MDVTVEIQGNDIGSYLISVEREEKLCSAGQTWTVEVDLNYPIEIMPWNSIVIYEEGNKALTGYVCSVMDHWGGGPPGITVSGLDTWKLALDGWSTEVYETNSGDTVKGLMAKYLDEAGLSYSFNGVSDESTPDSMYIPYMPYSEIMYELASSVGAYIRVDEDGVVQIGHIVDEMGDGPAISTGTNMISIAVEENDAKARNKVIVWGPNDTGNIRSDEDWATVDHTMVYASPFVQNAGILAAAIHGQLHDLEIIKTIDMPGDSSLKVGKRCEITGPANTWSGEDYCSSVAAYWNKDRGYWMTAKFGERCAIYGRGAPPVETDGRDVIVATYDFGVWRCKDIWAGSPHWEPLNIGLSTAYPDEDIPVNGGYSCDWFIRDPYEPNSRAFLVTKYGIYETFSLEPGYENWTPVLSNHRLQSLTLTNYTLKIRSTISSRGTYFIVAGSTGNEYGGWHKQILRTDDHFQTIQGDPACDPGGDDGGQNGMIQARCNLDHEENIGISSWHRLSRNTGAGEGGLAAHHRSVDGCYITGTGSSIASTGGPYAWYAIWDSYKELHMPWRVVACSGDPWWPDPSWRKWDWAAVVVSYNDAVSWTKASALHIPYDQPYIQVAIASWWSAVKHYEYYAKIPPVFYLIPGQWEGDGAVTTAVYPVKYTITNSSIPNGDLILANIAKTPIKNLPWGGTNCHTLQGSLGTYSPDREKVYCFNGAKPSRFATSEDECGSWSEKQSVPFKTSCFSGFPYSSQKVYAARDPVRDESAPHPGYNTDEDLIYSTRDKGDTAWDDATGDLYTETRDLHLRQKPGTSNWLGTKGLVTIAPRYC